MDQGCPGSNWVFQGRPGWTLADLGQTHIKRPSAPQYLYTGTKRPKTEQSSAGAEQIYLRSCCVGEARTELVAAQSVKTGPGRSLALLYIVRCTFPHRVLSTDCSRVFLMRGAVKLSGSGSGNVIWSDSDATLDIRGLYPCRLC